MSGQADANSDRAIPQPVLNRIPTYLRAAEDLLADGTETISSSRLAKILGLTDGQVRADLVYFGAFGRPGVGYRVAHLVEELRRVVGIDKPWPVALVGYGSIGRALVAHEGLRRRSFDIVVVLDADPAKVGRKAGRCTVQPVSELEQELTRREIRLAILAVPSGAAQDLAEQVAAAGVVGIMNFASVRLRLPEEVIVMNVDLTLLLERLSLRLKVAGH